MRDLCQAGTAEAITRTRRLPHRFLYWIPSESLIRWCRKLQALPATRHVSTAPSPTVGCSTSSLAVFHKRQIGTEGIQRPFACSVDCVRRAVTRQLRVTRASVSVRCSRQSLHRTAPHTTHAVPLGGVLSAHATHACRAARSRSIHRGCFP